MIRLRTLAFAIAVQFAAALNEEYETVLANACAGDISVHDAAELMVDMRWEEAEHSDHDHRRHMLAEDEHTHSDEGSMLTLEHEIEVSCLEIETTETTVDLEMTNNIMPIVDDIVVTMEEDAHADESSVAFALLPALPLLYRTVLLS